MRTGWVIILITSLELYSSLIQILFMFIEIICCFPPDLILQVFEHFIHFMDMVPVSVFPGP